MSQVPPLYLQLMYCISLANAYNQNLFNWYTMKLLSDILNFPLQNVRGHAVSVCGDATNIVWTAEQKVVINKSKFCI